MDALYRKAIVQSVLGIAFFIAILFLPAGTFSYWQGWLFLAVFSATATGFVIYLARNDKALLERRMNSGPWHEQGWSEKIIVGLVFLVFFGTMIFSAIDYRFGLSQVPPSVVVLGDLIILLSYLGIFWVVRVNSWAAANVAVEEGQKVVDTGPYAYVRHPMYAFAVWLFVGMPLSLGSWWPTLLIVLIIPVLVWRLLDEEKVLRRDLPGYSEYTQRVTYRLIPHVW